MPIYIDKTGYLLPKDRSYGVKKDVERIMQDVPLMTAAGTLIAGTGAGKIVCLQDAVNRVYGEYLEWMQPIGSCVAYGHGKAVIVVSATDILMRRESEDRMPNYPATEWLYGTGRVLVGKGRLGNSDGSIGSWQVKAMLQHGLLFRQVYGNHDLRQQDGRRERAWGYKSLPWQDLEREADLHPISQAAAKVSNYQEARDAIANGYPVTVCSNQGFQDKRDSQGFAKASGSWGHCMCFIGCDDTTRPGLLCDNSWGPNWISGPRRLNQPKGSFWVDAAICDRMLRQDDSWAIPGFNGFQRQQIDWSIF